VGLPLSHPAQLEFVASLKAKFPDYFVRKNVLEVGSLNINGSIRPFFEQCIYVGVDLGAGADVDVVARGEDLAYPDGSFDVTVSCECFEHNPAWVATLKNMIRMSSGLVFFSCATTGRAEHGTSRTSPQDAPFCGDYYCNLTEDDVRQEIDLSVFKVYEFLTNDNAHDLYFWGLK
jgi:SAM-dependent methyltransferase